MPLRGKMSSRWEQEVSGSVTLKEGRGKKFRRSCAKIRDREERLDCKSTP
jgi:hypothetical protein